MMDNEYTETNKNDPSSVYSLDYSSRNLKAISSDVSKYCNVKSINLSCNSIKSISKDIFHKNICLKELKLYSNQLTFLSGLQTLTRLEELQLQYNKISFIEDSLKYAKSLKFLRLDCNLLGELHNEEICSMIKLTNLDVSSNKLSNISALNSLVSLEELNCSDNLLTVVADLHSLKNLREIDLKNNKIVNISGLKSLPCLRTLILDNNKLKDICNLKCADQLQDLRISNNEITSIKNITEQFRNLGVLHIGGNNISDVSDSEHIFNLNGILQELIIYDNPVTVDATKRNKVYALLKSMNLAMLDMVYSTRVKPHTAMRPMSANQMVSTRYIENQLNIAEMSMADQIAKLNSEFASVYRDLNELPNVKKRDKILEDKEKKLHHSFQRPQSGCNNRTRIEDARAFADINF